MEKTQVQDFAFLVTDGEIINICTKFDFESYEQAKEDLKRILAPNWSVVEDQNIIKTYIEQNKQYIENLKKFEAYQTHLYSLELLIEQHLSTDRKVNTSEKLELLKSRVDIVGDALNGITTMSLEDYEWLVEVIEFMQETINEKVVIESNYLTNLVALDKDNQKLKRKANKHYIDMVFAQKQANRSK